MHNTNADAWALLGRPASLVRAAPRVAAFKASSILIYALNQPRHRRLHASLTSYP